MKSLLILLATSLLLAACGMGAVSAPPTVNVAQVGCLTVECAEQLIENQRATAVAATAQVQATREAANLQQTLTIGQAAAEATATAIIAQSIQDNIDSTEQAAAKTATVSGQTATAQVQATAQAYATTQAEQRAAAQLTDQVANQNAFRFIIVLVVIALVVLVISLAIGKFRWDAQQRTLERERQRQDRELERQRQMVLIMLAGLKTTPFGLIFTDPQTLRPQLMPPTESATLLRGDRPLPESEVGEVGHLIINDGDTSHVTPRLTPEEETGRQRMITFIEAAIAYWNRVDRNGPTRNQIPSTHRYTKHNLSPWNSGDVWQEHRNLFGPNLISTSAGTYCPTQYPTLGELREAVRQGRLPVFLPIKESVP